MVDLISFFKTRGIRYWTEGKNCKEGWVNITCRFCDDRSNHLGGNLSNGAFHCWRCGKHSFFEVIRFFEPHAAPEEIQEIIDEHSDYKSLGRRYSLDGPDTSEEDIDWPFFLKEECRPLYSRYLSNRNFAYDSLFYHWGVLLSGPDAFYEMLDFRFRLMIPVLWNSELVSFLGRDVTGKAKHRYLTCPKTKEKIHHKNILYGRKLGDKTRKRFIIVTEGVTDVWRLGADAAATFGIEFSRNQIRILANSTLHVFVMYDHGRAAQAQADKLIGELNFRGVKAENVSSYLPPGQDPADLTELDVKHILHDLERRARSA